jgi:asparagine synthase (glutamine-hydrolysing)
MCGIAGLLEIGGSPIDRRVLLRMTEILSHRGPDGSGWMEDDGNRLCRGVDRDGAAESVDPLPANSFSRPRIRAGLGHRRLSITDLSECGRQPMSRGEGRWWIVFNGAIYNAPELRRELEELGEPFFSRTDTEVLLAAYVRWGEACLERLNGMWAFAVWDSHRGELFCARDRFGIKPFFHTAPCASFAFASEPKALRPFREATPDREALREFLSCGALPCESEATVYTSYRSLPAGSCMTVTAAGVAVRRWYDGERAASAAARPRTFEDAAQELRSLLDSSLRFRLRADVRVGMSLSSGVDSGSLACLLAAIPPQERDHFSGWTVSTSFPGRPDIDETAGVRAVHRATGFRGYFIEPDEEELEAELDDYVYHLDEPCAFSNIYAQRVMYREARKNGLTVMLGGQGSDEIFGGYEPWDYYLEELRRGGRLFRAALEGFRSSSRRFGLLSGVHRFGGELRRGLLNRPPGWLAAPVPPLQEHLRRMAFFDYLPHLLRWQDRNSMSFGVESRLPFLDYRVVEFARSLPSSFLLRQGRTKAVLREAVRTMLPPPVAGRRNKLCFPGLVEGSARAPLHGSAAAWTRLSRGGGGPRGLGRRRPPDRGTRRLRFAFGCWMRGCAAVWEAIRREARRRVSRCFSKQRPRRRLPAFGGRRTKKAPTRERR